MSGKKSFMRGAVIGLPPNQNLLKKQPRGLRRLLPTLHREHKASMMKIVLVDEIKGRAGRMYQDLLKLRQRLSFLSA